MVLRPCLAFVRKGSGAQGCGPPSPAGMAAWQGRLSGLGGRALFAALSPSRRLPDGASPSAGSLAFISPLAQGTEGCTGLLLGLKVGGALLQSHLRHQCCDSSSLWRRRQGYLQLPDVKGRPAPHNSPLFPFPQSERRKASSHLVILLCKGPPTFSLSR